jgi:3-oxoacyl-[acyl-carrier-protein] synthase II
VTGLGAVTPLAVGAIASWNRLLQGAVATRALPPALYGIFPAQVAATVERGTGSGHFNAAAYIDKANVRTQSSDYIAFALAAAYEALRDARLLHPDGAGGPGANGGGSGEFPAQSARLRTDVALNLDRFGVALGSGIGGINEIAETAELLAGPPPPPQQPAGAAAAASPRRSSSSSSGAAASPPSEAGYRRMSPFFVPRILCNMAAGHVSIRYGLRGPNHAASTACATGAHAIGDAFRFIKHGDAEVMLAGGTEACISPIAIAGFAKARALATRYNATPGAASRPFDAGRDGFVLGEGSGVLVLEELEHALARGAPIYAEVRGYGACGDANHITAPAEDGNGALRCMQAALAEGGLSPWHVGYVNAHATSTPLGDQIEGHGIGRLFGSAKTAARLGRGLPAGPQQGAGSDAAGGSGRSAAPVLGAGREEHQPRNSSSSSGSGSGHGSAPSCKVAVSSTKGAIGHLLGAAGAVEAIFAVLAVARDAVPPTANLEQPDPELPDDVCDFVTTAAPGSEDAANAPRNAASSPQDIASTAGSACAASDHTADVPPHLRRRVRAALSNSFGFGGTNSSLLFAEWRPR